MSNQQARVAERDTPETSVSIIIPCYNESKVLRQVLEELQQVIAGIPTVDWQIVVVDDGSEIGVEAQLDDLPGIEVVTHPVNRGYGAALKTGIRAATGELVLTFDADGQHDPAAIPALLEQAGRFDLVAGNRVDSSGVPLARRPGKWLLLQLLNYLLGEKVPDMNCGLRLFRREVIARYLHLCSNRFSFSISSTMALLAEGHLVSFVPVRCREREGNPSRVGIGSAFDALLRMIRLGVVFFPLRVFLPLTGIMAVIAFGFLGYDLYTRDIHDVTVFLGIMSIMLFCFGLLSDQIAHLRRQIR